MKITYTTRRGQKVSWNYRDRAQMEASLRNLDASEARTKELAPTDSGDCRENDLRHAAALRAALN